MAEKDDNDKEQKNAAGEEQPEETPEKSTGDEPEKTQPSEDMPGASFFSPEIIMFIPAVSLDIIGLLLLFFALDDFFITDLVGIIIIGGWTYFRSQTLKTTKGAGQKIGKAGKWAKKMKWLRPLMIFGELVPYVGALPCWTLLVFFELQN